MALLLSSSSLAQKIGSLKDESHPTLTVQECTLKGGCATQTKSVVIDSNWRWIHEKEKPINCYTGNLWNGTLCPDPATCASNCVIEGAAEEYASTYGVTTSGSSLKLDFVTAGTTSTNVGSRLYLLDDESTYFQFKLKNKEFTVDVDVSQLPCGLNGALYMVSMDADGGMARNPGNEAGAKYGTGYCDAQCPHDVKFIAGEPNILDWVPSPTDASSGTGKYGSCCVELDIWEANSISTAYTMHSCSVTEATRCEGIDCGDNGKGQRFDGVCDKNGCDMQTYRLGNETFYGPGASFTIDTTKPVTVVTQFITEDGTDTGDLTEIKRLYKQGGVTVETPSVSVGGKMHGAITKDFCEDEVALFKDGTNFLEKGGLGSMGGALEQGMTLVMSLWDDHDVDMLWLDSTYPNASVPGGKRGSCPTTSGKPTDVEASAASAYVTYSNIRYGELGSTYAGNAPGPSPSPPAPGPPAPPSSSCKTEVWGQCGGEYWTGDTCCKLGMECKVMSADYSQCRPTSTLLEAFVHTQPTAKDVAAFIANGTTHFSPAGLAAYAVTPTAAATPVAAAKPAVVEAALESASGCPGGKLGACMSACPSSPLDAYAGCVRVCSSRCEAKKQLLS